MKHFFRIKYGLLLLLLGWFLHSSAQRSINGEELQRRIEEDSIRTVEELANTPMEEEEYQEEAPVFSLRTAPDSLVKELKENKKLQYQDIVQPPPKRYPWLEQLMRFLFSSISAIRIIIMLLLLGVFVFLVYLFMKSNGMSFFRKPQLVEGLTEIAEEDLHSAEEYEEKIRAAVAAGETRQAIRWWYLYTLFQLAGRELIVPGKEKTNNDYLRSMRNSPLYKRFATLTLDYEYIWYGGFEISPDNFSTIHQEFRDFNNAIGKAS
ncbi:DUF4129 domain-containing protein [Chitinophaga arvensicola]|uniref:Protein-glutamine gamma-glutamyltransferase-like C-terminal domain-containing protein n=1 Tax=Chitinophaga arvensicola TaxID=29529 RepID=A0A1I0SDA5_9BACT|nr:DUF4129 domain-containing protein [Chitinophaga arvensicola]SEW55432.1 protein of unknown function [Chitinophaga arvensicola]